MRKCKLTNQERIAAVKEYLNGHGSYATVARKYGIGRATLRAAVNLFKSQGEHAPYATTKNIHYPPELKRQAAEAYLSGEGSRRLSVTDSIFAQNLNCLTGLAGILVIMNSGRTPRPQE